MIYVAQALNNLRPNSHWTMLGDDYDAVNWLDENESIPTREEIEAEIVRLQTEFDNKEYQRLRAAEYPSFADQFDLLYHGGYDAWKQTIQAVKDKYPKP